MNQKLTKKQIWDFKKSLKKEGLKFTNQRFLTFKALFENKGHFDCEDIIFIMNK